MSTYRAPRASFGSGSSFGQDASCQIDGEPPVSVEQLIAKERGFVARMLRRAGVVDSAVDDAVQQVFVVAAGKLGAVRLGSERAFLVAIALNVAAHARRRVLRRREVDDQGIEELRDAAPTPDAALDAARLAADVSKALDALPPELREVLVLCHVEEHTMAEVAEQLGIPPGTVASRLRRARAELAVIVARVRPSRRMRIARKGRPPSVT
jgi:RNA polymerase sigma-70 factor (ECF subfamily)